MPASGKRKLVIGAAVIVCAAAGLLVWRLAPERGRPGKSIAVPAENVRFHLVPPGKEKRSGLYAMAEVQTPGLPELFGALVGGRVKNPVDGKPIVLVGKLPGTVNGMGFDFFRPEAGSVKDGEINIPVKFVRWGGEFTESPPPRAVYLTVYLPALPVGKYRARVTFEDYEHLGDEKKITRVGLGAGVAVGRAFAPLTCEFEVKPREPAP